MAINSNARKYLSIIAIFLSFLAGIILGNIAPDKYVSLEPKQNIINTGKQNVAETDVDFGLFWKTWKKIEEKYVDKDKLDKQKMVYGAIKGMVASLGDPYTVFMDPKDTEEFNNDLSGTFEGIGAELGIKEGALTIITPLKDSPAEKAGLKPQDKILKIENAISSDISIDEAVRRIRGPKGTKITLTILHKDDNEPREVTIVRDTINIKDVELSFKDDVAIIKITRFDSNTSDRVKEAASQILAMSPKGIVVDLRNNPGGYLESSIETAGIFLPKNSLVVTEDFGNGENKKHYSKESPVLMKIPVAALINEGSASAAEILAGALRDDRQIRLIGEKSYGKGSVQELVDLNSGSNSSLKITIAHWLTPSGLNINKEGISPDIEIKMTKDDYDNNLDPQMDEAIKMFK